MPVSSKLRLISATNLLLCVAALPLTLHCQTPAPTVMLVEPATPLLPQQFGPWQGATTQRTGQDNLPPVDSSALKEDGLVRSATATYQRKGSAEAVDIEAWQFGDATGAYAAFTFIRQPDARPLVGLKLGGDTVRQGSMILLRDGTTVVEAVFHNGESTSDLAALVATLPKAGGPKGLPPMLPTLLPAKGLEAETVRYALGPQSYAAMGGMLDAAMLGFGKSAEVLTAHYANEGTLTLLLYPTPQIAGEHGRAIAAFLNTPGAPAAGTVKLRREGPLVLLAMGAWKAADAQRIVENIHLRDEVTWDKKMPLEFHAEVQKTASLLYSIAMLSIVLMLAAVILGLFLGGGRALVRIMQGKPAASEPEFLRIDLRERPGEGGSFKPLH